LEEASFIIQIGEFKKEGCRREATPKLARIFNRSPNGAPKKLQRLGPDVVAARRSATTTFDTVKARPNLDGHPTFNKPTRKILSGVFGKTESHPVNPV
jgi:hypothetical protein